MNSANFNEVHFVTALRIKSMCPAKRANQIVIEIGGVSNILLSPRGPFPVMPFRKVDYTRHLISTGRDKLTSLSLEDFVKKGFAKGVAEKYD